MACPACGCKTTYTYGHEQGWDYEADDDRLERCAACGHIFDIEDHADEDDEHDG